MKCLELPEPIRDFFNMASRWMFGGQIREPKKEIPIAQLDKTSFGSEPPGGIRITWIGHSTLLIEIDGQRILTDPIWSKRCSPFKIIGPARFHPPPIPLSELPDLDAVLISHDHYDHLDKDSVCTLAQTGVPFYVPLGVGAYLERWGVDISKIVELDWWEKSIIKGSGIRFVATPARHFSGRRPLGMNKTLWASWVIAGPEHRVFFSGDSGPFPGFAEIGKELGPFDVTLIKIGAFDRTWPDIHLNPEQAVEAHLDLNGDLLIPIHWGTFNLALHDWFEPPVRLQKAAEAKSIKFAIPRPGQMVIPKNPPKVESWWEEND